MAHRYNIRFNKSRDGVINEDNFSEAGKITGYLHPLEIEFDKEIKRVTNAVQDAIFALDINLPEYLNKANEHAEKQKEHLNNQLKVIEKQLSNVDVQFKQTENALKQEKALLCIFKNKLVEGSITGNCLAMIDEKLEDITLAQRNEFGLPVNDSSLIEAPLLEDMHGFDMKVLQNSVSVAQSGVIARASVGKQLKRKLDGEIPFKIGNIMQETGEIQGTSDAIFNAVKKHEQKKVQNELTLERKAAGKKQKTAEDLQALLPELEQAKAKIQGNLGDAKPRSVLVKDCKAFLQLLQKQERLANGINSERSRDLRDIAKKKGDDLRIAVLSLAHPK